MKNLDNEMVRSDTSPRVWIPTKTIGIGADICSEDVAKSHDYCIQKKTSKFKIMINKSFIAESKENTHKDGQSRHLLSWHQNHGFDTLLDPSAHP